MKNYSILKLLVFGLMFTSVLKANSYHPNGYYLPKITLSANLQILKIDELKKFPKNDLNRLVSLVKKDELSFYDKSDISLFNSNYNGISYGSLIINKDYNKLKSYDLTSEYSQSTQGGGGLLRDMIVGAAFFGIGGWAIDKIGGTNDFNFGTWLGVGAGIGLIFHFVK